MAITINGDGSISGISVGGLPDGTVDEGTLATDSVTAAKIPASLESTFVLGRKNLIINGDMRVAQRGTSFSSTTSTIYTVDRWRNAIGSSFNLDTTITQSTTVPSGEGFKYSLKVEADSVVSTSSGQNGGIMQILESQDVQRLAYGTSNAKSLTLSFWTRSNKTGTYCVQLQTNVGNSTSSNRYSHIKEYTINSANTWEKKTLTFSGHTGQAIDSADTNDALRINWWLASDAADNQTANTWNQVAAFGSTSNQVNFMDSASNEWYLTGCQLEVGSTATDFEHRSYGEELALCQRYYEIVADASQSSDSTIHYVCGGFSTKSDQVNWNYFFQVVKRGAFTLEATTGTDYYKARNYTDFIVDTAVGMTASYQGLNCVNGYISGSYSGSTEGKAWQFTLNNANAKIAVSAEL